MSGRSPAQRRPYGRVACSRERRRTARRGIPEGSALAGLKDKHHASAFLLEPHLIGQLLHEE